MPSECSILFSAPMVRAIRDGTKTQTRRVVKGSDTWGAFAVSARPLDARTWRIEGDVSIPAAVFGNDKTFVDVQCPYGQPGDLIIVRESAWFFGRWYRDGFTKRGRQRWRFRELERKVRYEQPLDHELTYQGSEYDGYVFRPSIHMPRWASRFTLKVTDVRVERLQAISEADAEAEGIAFMRETPDVDETLTARHLYSALWDHINGKRDFPWNDNPWVWVVSFKRVTTGGPTDA